MRSKSRSVSVIHSSSILLLIWLRLKVAWYGKFCQSFKFLRYAGSPPNGQNRNKTQTPVKFPKTEQAHRHFVNTFEKSFEKGEAITSKSFAVFCIMSVSSCLFVQSFILKNAHGQKLKQNTGITRVCLVDTEFLFCFETVGV